MTGRFEPISVVVEYERECTDHSAHWSLTRAWRRDTDESVEVDLEWFAEDPPSKVDEITDAVIRGMAGGLEFGQSYALHVFVDAKETAGQTRYFTFSKAMLESLLNDDDIEE